MTYSPFKENDIFGAFGELITAHKTPVVQIANKYQKDPATQVSTLEVFEATGGSADNIDNLFRCQTGTSLGGYGVVRSKETLNYRAGQGIEAQFTASFTTGVALSLQFGGMFNLTDTLAFGYNGVDFSCLHSYGGAAEMQEIEVTATGAGTCTVTLDGDAVAITVTSSTTATNAEELRAGLAADGTLSAKWRFEQVDSSVFCIARAAAVKAGAFSVSGGLTATITQRKAGAAKVDNHTAQSNWNVTTSPFSGFDPTKLNVYKIQLGYLGVANVNFSIYNPETGRWVLVHRIKWSNANTITHISTPNFKVGWTAASLGSTGTNLTVTGASASLMLEGDEVKSNDVHAIEQLKTSIGTTLTNVVTIKNRLAYNTLYNLGKAKPLRLSVALEHTKGGFIEIIKNATLGGTPNYQYQSESTSIVVFDTSGTTVTGGEIIDGLAISANSSAQINLSELLINMAPEDTLTFAFKTTSQTADNVTVFVTWKEEK